MIKQRDLTEINRMVWLDVASMPLHLQQTNWVVDEFEEQLKQREEELKINDKTPKPSKMDAVKEDSEWDDDVDDEESDRSMGLDA